MFRRFLSMYPKYTLTKKRGEKSTFKSIPAPVKPPVPPPSGIWFIP